VLEDEQAHGYRGQDVHDRVHLARRPTRQYRPTWEMKPHRIPWVIEKVRGMSTMVRNAGRPSSSRAKSMAADALEHGGPDQDQHRRRRVGRHHPASGATKKQGRKHSAVTTDVNPVRPPALMPAALSI
jgi:hypothetical protein